MVDFGNIIKYTMLGFTHVIPFGLDHILFILSIFLLNSKLKPVIIQCSVFTLAHSFSLGAANAGIIAVNSAYIEPLIAISILYVAIENIISTQINPFRLIVIFCFGLVHGLGFASALKEIGIPENKFFSSLLSFNIGVELGQLSIILLSYLTISKLFSNKPMYKERIVFPISSIIGCVALYWTIERIISL